MRSLSKTEELAIYSFIAYLASSARGLLIEPQIYGPFRCLDAISRFIDLLGKLGISSMYLNELKEDIDKGKYLLLYDEDKFKEFIKQINFKFNKFKY